MLLVAVVIVFNGFTVYHICWDIYWVIVYATASV